MTKVIKLRGTYFYSKKQLFEMFVFCRKEFIGCVLSLSPLFRRKQQNHHCISCFHYPKKASAQSHILNKSRNKEVNQPVTTTRKNTVPVFVGEQP